MTIEINLEDIYLDLKPSDSDISWLSATLRMIHLLSSIDPLPVHFFLSRDTLREKKIFDDRAVDLLARELVTYCHKIKHHISLYLEAIGGIWKDGRLTLHVDESLFCERDESNLMDLLFSEFVHSIGKAGSKASVAIQTSAKERYRIYKSSNYLNEHRPGAWSLWIKSVPEYSIFSPYLAILADIVWDDVCSPAWERKEKNVPALTHGVHPAVTRILSPRAEARQVEDQLLMMHEGRIIATLPTIDPKLIPSVTKGAGNLNSIYHHKLIRFECKSGFENWIHAKPDARVLRFERGCTEIAERLGLKSNRAIEEIKALLITQAYMHFSFEDGSSGNLIVMRNFRSQGCNRDDGIEIVLGTQFLPHYTFQTSKRERLLIPVPELPPFVSSTNYHAGQSLLQMMVMEEFTEQSIEFFLNGSICITEEKWKEFASETLLPSSVFKQTIDRWLHDGDDGPKFLDRCGVDRYTLGPTYQKEIEFLKYQGCLRKQRRKDGEKSAIARKKKTLIQK